MRVILIKELNDFLHSLMGYLVILVFLVGIGMIMWVIPDTNVLDYGYATMEPLFSIGPYMLIFLVPAVTMKSFSEENRTGTLELLGTLPFTNWDLILGKFSAAVLVVLLSILPTLVYYISLYQLGNPVGNLDTSSIIGSYIGMALLAALFTSIGLLVSAISQNQIISFLGSAIICFLFYGGFDLVASIDIWGSWSYKVEQLGILDHYNGLSKGLIEMNDIIYFVGLTAIFIMTTRYILHSQR